MHVRLNKKLTKNILYGSNIKKLSENIKKRYDIIIGESHEDSKSLELYSVNGIAFIYKKVVDYDSNFHYILQFIKTR